MTVKKCDRCGEMGPDVRFSLLADFPIGATQNRRVAFLTAADYYGKPDQLDFCEDCARGLSSWFDLIVDADKK